MEATISGDSYVLDLARYIRTHEQSLSGSTIPQTKGTQVRPTLVPPKPLSISLHHLSYVLLRFDALGLHAGPLDDAIPTPSRPRSTFSYISSGEQRHPTKSLPNLETASLSSFRSAISRMSISAASTTSSWFSRPTPPSPDQELRYLYSAFSKLPALEIVPPPMSGLVEGFEDTANPTTLTPFDVFKNLHLLSFTDVDPRTVVGWDRLACQLRSLTMTRTGLEDIEELLVKQVVADAARRRQRQGVREQAEASASTSTKDSEASSSTAKGASAEDLPSLAWQFLTNLGLPSSSLTFFTILHLPALRSLDLSHNLLNSIPPALSMLPALQSLDLSGNLIEDARGVREALPQIRTLNLRGNRLDSLSGLDALVSLKQIDVRDNAVYEPSEIGRLAQLTRLSHVWIGGNPLWEEYPDPRVEVLLEFAKEGWPLEGKGTVYLDGEAAGYFERKRVVERLPLGLKLAPPGTVRRPTRASFEDHRRYSVTPKAVESRRDRSDAKGHRDVSIESDQDALNPGPKVVAVKHHRRGRTGESSPGGASSPKKKVASKTADLLALRSDNDPQRFGDGSQGADLDYSRGSKFGSESRRNPRHRKRIVDFDSEDRVRGDERPPAASLKAGKPERAEEITEAERLKRGVLSSMQGTDGAQEVSAVQSNDYKAKPSENDADAVDRPTASTTTSRDTPQPTSAPSSASAMVPHKYDTLSHSGGNRASRDSSEVGRGLRVSSDEVKASRSSREGGRPGGGKTSADQIGDQKSKATTQSSTQPSHDLRARIDRLKQEVGEDWLRVLSRGE